MKPGLERKITFGFCGLLLIAAALRHYLNTRESFRLVEETIPFSITNDVVTMHYWRGDFARTNAELAATVRPSAKNVAVVNMRERMVGRKVIGWKMVEVNVPAPPLQP